MSLFTLCPNPIQLLQIRQESLLRKKAMTTFGPQGTLDLALLGAILGNHIQEIGRFKVTCDGELVHGRYSIHELVNFGVLSVTGRRIRRSPSTSLSSSRRNSDCSLSSSTRFSTDSTISTRLYPATLANLFPALVFKALRRKAVRAPKFRPDDDEEEMQSISPLSHIFPCDEDLVQNMNGLLKSATDTTATSTETGQEDAMLISSEKVLAALAQQRLHQVKDLPLPRELCFLGAASLPLPPVLRTMHVAWTMDFLQVRARTPRRQRKQQQKDGHGLGGLDFRPDLYAHKMRLARLVRAQQHGKGKGKAGPGPTRTRVSPPSAAMHMGPSSISIPEENEDELDEHSQEQEQHNVVKAFVATATTKTIPKPIMIPTAATPVLKRIERTTTAAASTTCEPAAAAPRQDKRMMQQLLSLENKVPRIVRQWAIAARACFAEELQQEDRLVQEWVDRQRLQVVLGFRGCMSSSSATSSAAMSSTTANSSRSRPKLSPILTNVNTITGQVHHPNGSAMHSRSSSSNGQRIHHRLSSSLPSTAGALTGSSSSSSSPFFSSRTGGSRGLLATIEDSMAPACFPEGVRQNASQGLDDALLTHNNHTSSLLASRPTSVSVNDHQRLSCSQQMLGMHLWLSLLVSPLSPQQMMHDRLGFWPCAETDNNV
ncbi:hypothetical protein BGZ83_007178 [Gryganskiella cystojenkinii]|nr:hypothetical protein BGZ83_007178 [Gryganskiella cystojenkinii]